MDECYSFTSKDEEIDYWKRLAHDYKQSAEIAREELDEFQISSRELESELEAQLEHAEKKNRELNALNCRQQIEIDGLREKLNDQEKNSHKLISELQDELSQLRAFRAELQKYIRELEQVNDDLERAKRSTVTSLEDFESRLNMAIERNAFLESELEEKEHLSVTVQRLKDEARDLRQELHITDSKKPEEPEEPQLSNEKLLDNSSTQKELDSNGYMEVNEQSDTKIINVCPDSYITPLNTPAKVMVHNVTNGTPLTPSARISALNIVGDLLRKVGALESKLASCRNFVKDQPRSKSFNSAATLNSPRSSIYAGSRR